MYVKALWRWKEVGVGDEELTKNHIKLVRGPQVGQGIIPNTFRKVGEYYIFEIEWEPCD